MVVLLAKYRMVWGSFKVTTPYSSRTTLIDHALLLLSMQSENKKAGEAAEGDAVVEDKKPEKKKA